MASLRPQPPTQLTSLYLWFMLFVLCLHHYSARKVLLNDLKRENTQPRENVKSASFKSGQVNSSDVPIGFGCGSHNCPPPGSIPCFQEPCQPYISIPQPPHIVYPPSIIVPTPPIVIPAPCTPCEPWYGPGPCPCEPCEVGAVNKEGDNAQGHKSNSKAKEGEKLVSSEQPDKEKQVGAPSSIQERLSSVTPSKVMTDGAIFHR